MPSFNLKDIIQPVLKLFATCLSVITLAGLTSCSNTKSFANNSSKSVVSATEKPQSIVLLVVAQTAKSDSSLETVSKFEPRQLAPVQKAMMDNGGGELTFLHNCDRGTQSAIRLKIPAQPSFDPKIDRAVSGSPFDKLKLAKAAYAQRLKKSQSSVLAEIDAFNRQVTNALKIPRTCRQGDLQATLDRNKLLLNEPRSGSPRKYTVVISDRLGGYTPIRSSYKNDSTSIVVKGGGSANVAGLKPDMVFESPIPAFAAIEKAIIGEKP